MTYFRTAILAAFLTIVGCTPYQENSFLGGYDEIQLDEFVYQVTFRGNKYTGTQRAIDFTLLRSAELTLEAGMSHFAIIESDAREKQSISYNPGSLNVAPSYGVSSKPRTSNTIVVFREKPADVFTYDAKTVASSIRAKYDL